MYQKIVKVMLTIVCLVLVTGKFISFLKKLTFLHSKLYFLVVQSEQTKLAKLSLLSRLLGGDLGPISQMRHPCSSAGLRHCKAF